MAGRGRRRVDGGFGMPQKLETSFERGLELLVAGLTRRTR